MSSYCLPLSRQAANDLAEEIAVDPYFDGDDRQALLAGLEDAQRQQLDQLIRELRANMFLTDEVIDAYGQRIWRLLVSEN